jgi:hypothetical protein
MNSAVRLLAIAPLVLSSLAGCSAADDEDIIEIAPTGDKADGFRINVELTERVPYQPFAVQCTGRPRCRGTAEIAPGSEQLGEMESAAIDSMKPVTLFTVRLDDAEFAAIFDPADGGSEKIVDRATGEISPAGEPSLFTSWTFPFDADGPDAEVRLNIAMEREAFATLESPVIYWLVVEWE